MIRTFNDEEIKKIFSYCKNQTNVSVKRLDRRGDGSLTKFARERDYLMVILLTDTGLRISELLNLKMEDIGNGEIHVKRAKGKKGCSRDNSACEGFFGRLKNEVLGVRT